MTFRSLSQCLHCLHSNREHFQNLVEHLTAYIPPIPYTPLFNKRSVDSVDKYVSAYPTTIFDVYTSVYRSGLSTLHLCSQGHAGGIRARKNPPPTRETGLSFDRLCHPWHSRHWLIYRRCCWCQRGFVALSATGISVLVVMRNRSCDRLNVLAAALASSAHRNVVDHRMSRNDTHESLSRSTDSQHPVSRCWMR